MYGRSLRCVGVLILATTAWGQYTGRLSVGAGGVQSTGDSSNPAITPDGRFIAYSSKATNIVPGDASVFSDVYVRDRLRGTTKVASLAADGNNGNGYSAFEETPAISSDGRFVAFTSGASNLVPNDTNGKVDVFVRDLEVGTTERVSDSTTHVQGDDHCHPPCSISADGRYVAFCSSARNLVPDVVSIVEVAHIYVRDRQRGTTEIVDVGLDGLPAWGVGLDPSISADGRFVAFSSSDWLLVQGDSNSDEDVFVRDRLTRLTRLASVSVLGTSGNDFSHQPSLSSDGLHVAFRSNATDLVLNQPSTSGLFIRNLQSGTTEFLTPEPFRNDVDYGDTYGHPTVSGDGRWVAFSSTVRNLVAGDTNRVRDVFLLDRSSGTTERVSMTWDGVESDGWSSVISRPALSDDGRFVAFDSRAANLVPQDTNGKEDIFLRDLRPTAFTRVCDPGISGVVGCPCANPPAEYGRGCDNSASTGGATLSASGDAYTTHDGLVFTTENEPVGAASVLLQGGGFVSGGFAYGQGVLCIGGPLTRLYTREAATGGIRVPDSAAQDLSVSDRSTMLGCPVSVGRSRYYVVLYRDVVALPGCASAPRLNLTPTARVEWSF